MKLGVSHQQWDQIQGPHLAYLKQMGVEALEVRLPSDLCTHAKLEEVK